MKRKPKPVKAWKRVAILKQGYLVVVCGPIIGLRDARQWFVPLHGDKAVRVEIRVLK